jgi:hypothetical protein
MDRGTRNKSERGTRKARKILEEDFSGQFSGDVAAKPEAHFSSQQRSSVKRS